MAGETAMRKSLENFSSANVEFRIIFHIFHLSCQGYSAKKRRLNYFLIRSKSEYEFVILTNKKNKLWWCCFHCVRITLKGTVRPKMKNVIIICSLPRQLKHRWSFLNFTAKRHSSIFPNNEMASYSSSWVVRVLTSPKFPNWFGKTLFTTLFKPKSSL